MTAEDEITVQTKVTTIGPATTVLDYLSNRFTYLSPAQWRQLLAEGRVRVDGHLAGPTTDAVAGAIISSTLPAPSATIPAYNVVYEDQWLLAVNKPAGLRVHGRGPFMRANLIYHLRQHGYPDATLVNRLDSDTSGIVILARKATFLPDLQAQFSRQEVEKQYLAWVHGQPPLSGSISHSLRDVPGGDERRRYVRPDPAGRAARTDFQLVQQQDQYALLHLWPRTGRTHQIRAHLAAIGHPVVGDWQYGRQADRAALGLNRHLLHCRQTSFRHPWLASPLTLDVSPPADFALEQP